MNTIPQNWQPAASCNTSGFVDPNEIEQGIRNLAYQAGFDHNKTVKCEVDQNVFTVYVSPELAKALEAM